MHDHDRKLNERGRESADALAQHFVRMKIMPDHIICSSAQRTQDTLAPILAALKLDNAMVDYTPDIYEAPMSAYCSCIAGAKAEASVLVVGHNPTTEELVLSLSNSNREPLSSAISMGYPTGGLTHIRFNDGPWDEALRRGGDFVSFVSPKMLTI